MTTNNIVNTMTKLLKALQVLLLVTISVVAQAAVESTTYILTDHLGSPILATDENGDTLWQEDYLPYGKQLTNEDGDNSVGFTGHKDDKALGVTYMQGRWYHQDMGRFLAIDPVGFVEGNPASFNRYAYANSNPYKFIDPDGRFSIELKSNSRLRLEKDDPAWKKKLEDRLGTIANRSKPFKTINKGKDFGESLMGETSTSQLPGKSEKEFWEDIENVDKMLQDFFESAEGDKYPGFNDWWRGDQWTPESFEEAMTGFGDYLQKRDRNVRGPSITKFKELYGSPWETESPGGLLYRERERSGITRE